MNIEKILNSVKQVKAAQDKGATGVASSSDTESAIAQKLTPDQKNCLPKNIVAKGEDGDTAKVEELLAEIARTGEAKGASEALLTAKLAEEAAEQDMEVISKQAAYFGAVMADSMINKLAQANEVTDKQASDAAEAEYARWYKSGCAVADGYLDKLAAAHEEATAGVLNNNAIPAQVNQEETAEIDENTVEYIAAEVAKDLAAQEGGAGAPKNASEKEAGTMGVLKDHIRSLLAGGSAKAKVVGHRVYRKPVNYNAKKDVLTGKISPDKGSLGYQAVGGAKAHPYVTAGGAMALGGVGAYAMRGDKKASTDDIFSAYMSGDLDVKSAAEAIVISKQEEIKG